MAVTHVLLRQCQSTWMLESSVDIMSINRLMQVNVEAPSEHACSSSTVESIHVYSIHRSALLYKV
jgi:hypothetical protein